MTRRLLNFLTALSMLLCVAVCVLWVRGQWKGDELFHTLGEYHNVGAYFNRGCVLVEVDDCPIGSEPPVWDVFDSRASPVTAESFPEWCGGAGQYAVRGFGFAVGEFFAGSRPVQYQIVVVPYWFLTLLFTAMPLRRACLRRVYRRGGGGGHCMVCGYDLRATPHRCPECGAASNVVLPG